jgi:hypothetical protein
MTSPLARILIDKWEGNHQGRREDMRSKLQHGVWVVEFKKTDGTPTTMECTLDSKMTPPLKEGVERRVEQDHWLHVYSMDRAGWRSFIVENVTDFYKKPDML